MSHPARATRSGIDGQANAASRRYAGTVFLDLSPADGAGVGSAGRTSRVRNRVKIGPEEKVKKPADGVRKKSPPARKAPARGRYVDEYARPGW